jgi:hypothetical protein
MKSNYNNRNNQENMRQSLKKPTYSYMDKENALNESNFS